MHYPRDLKWSYIPLMYGDSARVMNRQKRHIVELKEDVATGELVLEIPESIISEMGWYEGTELEWTLEGNEVFLRDANNA